MRTQKIFVCEHECNKPKLTKIIMKKSLLNQKTAFRFFSILCMLLLFSTFGWGQQVIGSFPTMDGGFENQTGTLATLSAVSTDQANWTTQIVATGVVSNSGGRSGPKFVTYSQSGTTNRRLQSPTANGLTTVTDYRIQFWYKGDLDGTVVASNLRGGVSSNQSVDSQYTSYVSANSGDVWTLFEGTKTTIAQSTAGTFGIGSVSVNNTCQFKIDDFVIYQGTVADSTPPNVATLPTVPATAATQQTISWTSPAIGGVDGGGYMVVRSTADPTTTPNNKGIYAIGNFVAGTEQVVYLGTATSFTDLGLSASTQYFYRIYTVDKAFNYSAALTTNATTTAAGFAAEPTAQTTGLSFTSLTATNASTGFTINFTNASSGGGTNHLVVVKPIADFTTNPADGNSYTANAIFGSGTVFDNSGYIVYNGTGNAVTVTGLSKFTNYYVRVYDFNGSAGTENYNTTTPNSNSQTSLMGEISSSGTSGIWSSGTSWSGGTVPGQYDNVTITGSDVILVAATSSCNNLTINSGAKVWNQTLGKTIKIYGTSLVCNGTFGDISDNITIAPALGSQLTTEFGGNLTVSGTGSFYPFKIRPVTGLSNIGVTFNATTQVITAASGTAILSDNTGNDNITYTVSSGKTVSIVSNVSMASSTSTNGTANTTINILGTCIVNGAFATPIASGKTCTVNVNGTLTGGTSISPYSVSGGGVSTFNVNGVCTTSNFNVTPLLAVVAPVINVGPSGSITVNGTADFSNTSVVGFIGNTPSTTGGTFVLASTGTIKLANASGLEAIAGPIRTTTRTLNSGSSYFYVGAAAQVTGADLPASIYNLTVATTNSAAVTLGSTTNLTNKLTVTSGSLNTAGLLTLKSTECCTAYVAPVLSTETTPISGNVTVERYISAKRAWRALTAPVNTTTSIFANWQQNGTGNSANGLDIWMPSGTNGLTAGGAGNSLLEYDSANNLWTGITATNGTSSMMSGSKNKPFMAFVTGPYGTNNITSGATATTLKATGALLTGTQTYATAAGKYAFIGNPYASPLSLISMLADTDNATNFSNGIWIWDSNATGGNSVGTYNLFTSGVYTNLTSNVLIESAEIQSGQAFFVQSAINTTFSIKEAHKGTTVNNVVLRTAAPELLRVGLYKEINSEWSGRDGAMAVILADADANQTTNKMANGTENVAFTKNGLLFASEHHLPLIATDVLNVKVWNTTAGANYKLKINTEQFTSSLSATLEDAFTNSRTPLTLDGSAVEYPFSVTAEALSTGNRFRIVFESNALGINNPAATGISILPNPVTGDAFQVNLGTLAMGTYSYSICNAIGQEVEKGSINNVAQNTSYSVKFKSAIAAGMYIMKVTGTNNSVFTAKLIKQ